MDTELTEWVSIDPDPSPLGSLTLDELNKTEILFDNGVTVKYFDEWPFAIATHYRIKGEEVASELL